MESQKQCKGCVYWKACTGCFNMGTLYMCHHLLETGKRRVDKDGVCMSRTTLGDKARIRKLKQLVLKPKTENKCKKKVKAVEDNIVFDSMTEAEKYYGLAHGRVCAVTNNPNKTARGQHFITV